MGQHLICLVNAAEQGPSLSYSKLLGADEGNLGASKNPGHEPGTLSPSSQLPDVSFSKWGTLHEDVALFTSAVCSRTGG